MAFTGAATTVVAQTFILQDPNGVVAAIFSTGNGTHGPFTSTFSALDMFHRDVATTDSSLTWTDGNAPLGNESVTLTGPVDAGGGTYRPYFSVFRSSPGLGVTTRARMEAGAPSGIQVFEADAFIDVSASGVAGGTFIRLHSPGGFHVDNDQLPIDYRASATNDTRGSIYGATFDSAALGASPNLLIAPQFLITVNELVYPGGGYLDISWTIDLQCLIAGTLALCDIFVNGVVASPVITCNDGILNARHTYSSRVLYPVAVGVAPQVQVRAYCSANNGYQAIATQTTLQVVNYR